MPTKLQREMKWKKALCSERKKETSQVLYLALCLIVTIALSVHSGKGLP